MDHTAHSLKEAPGYKRQTCLPGGQRLIRFLQANPSGFSSPGQSMMPMRAFHPPCGYAVQPHRWTMARCRWVWRLQAAVVSYLALLYQPTGSCPACGGALGGW
jgi:hypothetical protein